MLSPEQATKARQQRGPILIWGHAFSPVAVRRDSLTMLAKPIGIACKFNELLCWVWRLDSFVQRSLKSSNSSRHACGIQKSLGVEFALSDGHGLGFLIAGNGRSSHKITFTT
jgi:hypothetical protein